MTSGWTSWRRIVPFVALVGLGVVPGIVTNGIVDGSMTVAVAAACAVVAAVLTLVVLAALARRGAGSAASTVAVVALGLLGAAAAAIAVTLAAPVRPDDGALSTVVDALTHGWSTIVRSPVPADPEPRMLVPIALSAWSATVAGVALARRTTAALAPLVPVVTAIVAASVAAGETQYRPVVTGLLVLGLAGVFVASRAPGNAGRAAEPARTAVPRATSNVRQATAGAVVVAAITAGAVVVGPALALGRDADPFDPREHWVPPAIPEGTTSPLDLVASRLQLPEQSMFTTTSSAPVTTRLVAFDEFDGATWSMSGAFERTGAVLPVDLPTAVPTEPADATITVTGLTGPWLPSIADTIRIDGTSVLVEPLSGSLAAVGGAAAGSTYDVQAVMATPELASLQATPVADDPAARAALAIGDDVPADLREMAGVATAGASSPLTKAALLELYLRSNFEIDPEGIGGYSYGHLLRALTVTGQGTSAQFAAAFVVLGRVAGLPTRLVVGFGPGELNADGRYEVRSGDVTVWPEVRFAGAGWIAFDPAPALGGSANDGGGTVSVGVGPSQDVVIEPSADDPPDDLGGDDTAGGGGGGGDDTADGASATSPWLRVATVGGSALLALAVLVPLAVVVVKRRRTARRRRAAEPRRQVLGAWHDVLDRLREHGVEDAGARTVGELVAASEATSVALAGLYRPVNRALYDDRPTPPEDVEQAWRARDRYVDDVRRTEPTHRRVRHSIDPRPLLTRSTERVLEEVS